jgi:hypothetical protein
MRETMKKFNQQELVEAIAGDSRFDLRLPAPVNNNSTSGVTMNRTAVPWYCRPSECLLKRRIFVAFLIFFVVAVTAGIAEDVSPQSNSAPALRVTHLLGFAGARNNAKGTLSIEGDALQFQKSGKPSVQVKITSIQDVVLGDQSRQVGGVPMTLAKAAIPFSGGRAVSLFSHKKYDTLTLEYVDSEGGFHGAIFELKKGKAEAFRDELVAKGARAVNKEGASTKQTAEVLSENK